MHKALLCLAVLSLAGCRQAGPQFPASSAQAPVRSSGQQSYADVVAKDAPAVVTIRSEKIVRPPRQFPFFNDPFFRQFFGGAVPRPRPQVEHSLGSGVTVSQDGYIITNHHVIDGAEDIQVEYTQGRRYKARLVGSDPPSDIAVLKVPASGLPVLNLGNSDSVRVGDVVLAIGNPLGIGQTVTMGIISAKGRATGLSDGSFEDFLQTDAAINQGNSGGALINTASELVGISSQILSTTGGNIGIGFAIPSNMTREVMNQLIQSGKVRRGQLGVVVQQLTQELASGLGLQDTKGVLIADVTAGGPGDRAGLRRGDVIRAINGEEVTDPNTLRNRISSIAPGSGVTLTIVRDGKEQQVKATLGEFQPPAPAGDQDQGSQGQGGGAGDAAAGRLGLTAAPLTPDLARQLGLSGVNSGVVVTDVDPAGPAADAGLAPGDVIVEANRRPVRSPRDLQDAISRGGTVLLLVNRKGTTNFVTVQPRR